MCNFISWIEYKGINYFIEDSDLETKQGKKLLAEGYKDDIEGHGAIQHYYPELLGKGKHHECEDFTTPNKFPKEIAKALVSGRLSRIGLTLDVLNKEGKIEYEKVRQPARQEYVKV